MHIAFIGLGYIGLPTAVIFARKGQNVTGVDINSKVVEAVNDGRVTIVEPGLELALQDVVDKGLLKASTEVPEANVFIIAVPTPIKKNHDGDLSYVMSAAESVAAVLKGGELIVLESTSPPGATEQLARKVRELRPDLKLDGVDDLGEGAPVYFAHCPERILPGNAMQELVTNDRIIGGLTPEATKRAIKVYETFCEGELLASDAKTAEMAKLTENTFRDVNIAFANELSLICDNLGVNVWELIELANHHPRVNILQPGPGVGGHCIAVDPWFLIASDRENSNLSQVARLINDGKPEWVLQKVQAEATKIESPTIAVLGLAFKANIDDLRESPALHIATKLVDRLPNSLFKVVEPNIQTLPASLQHSRVELSSLQKALQDSEIVLLLVDHDQFKEIDREILENHKVIDTKGIWR